MTHEELRAELQRVQSMTEPEINALVQRAIAVIRNHTLEEAARVAEPQEMYDDPLTAHKIAAAIRSLKGSDNVQQT